MEKLKVGDKVCCYITKGLYLFSEVVRITKTTAILSTGHRLKNDPTNAFGGISFKEIGTRYNFINW